VRFWNHVPLAESAFPRKYGPKSRCVPTRRATCGPVAGRVATSAVDDIPVVYRAGASLNRPSTRVENRHVQGQTPDPARRDGPGTAPGPLGVERARVDLDHVPVRVEDLELREACCRARADLHPLEVISVFAVALRAQGLERLAVAAHSDREVDVAGVQLLASLAAGNYRVLTAAESARLVRFGKAVRACLIDDTRISMRLDSASGRPSSRAGSRRAASSSPGRPGARRSAS
jgi:hypothetical protein